jgi:hypothetical protein
MHSILSLVEDHRVWSLHHCVVTLHASFCWQAMHKDALGPRLFHHLIVHLHMHKRNFESFDQECSTIHIDVWSFSSDNLPSTAMSPIEIDVLEC